MSTGSSRQRHRAWSVSKLPLRQDRRTGGLPQAALLPVDWQSDDGRESTRALHSNQFNVLIPAFKTAQFLRNFSLCVCAIFGFPRRRRRERRGKQAKTLPFLYRFEPFFSRSSFGAGGRGLKGAPPALNRQPEGRCRWGGRDAPARAAPSVERSSAMYVFAECIPTARTRSGPAPVRHPYRCCPKAISNFKEQKPPPTPKIGPKTD